MDEFRLSWRRSLGYTEALPLVEWDSVQRERESKPFKGEQMTIEEFLGKLPKEGWMMSAGQFIRREDTCQCPIEYVAGTDAGWLATAVQRLELDGGPYKIIHAADMTGTPLRQRLLEACGLVERNG